MPKNTIRDQCADPTQKLTLEIPCRLAERVETYAKKTEASLENVVIEALDVFLRGQKNKHQ
jgi:hypothetical protein